MDEGFPCRPLSLRPLIEARKPCAGDSGWASRDRHGHGRARPWPQADYVRPVGPREHGGVPVIAIFYLMFFLLLDSKQHFIFVPNMERFAVPRWWSSGNSKRRFLLRFCSAKVTGRSSD
jgi:hypothetical protein